MGIQRIVSLNHMKATNNLHLNNDWTPSSPRVTGHHSSALKGDELFHPP